MSNVVKLSMKDGIATVTLNQPDRRNALSVELEEGIHDALDEIETSEVRCLVIQGAGGAFSAGGDIERMQEWLEAEIPLDERVKAVERTTSQTIARVATFPLPTVAKIDGPAVGAGANLAIACDLQLASDRARIGFVFRGVGLSVDAGTSYLLPRLVGENIAKELVFTGEIVDADRALDIGLVNHVFPEEDFDERADEVFEPIATGPTVALRHAKHLVGGGFERSLEEAMRAEATAQGIVFETADHEEGVSAFLDRREPDFEGR